MSFMQSMVQATTKSPIKAAIFDMDGTLFDTERLRLKLFKQASLALLGFEFSDEFLLSCLGLNEQSAAALANQFYQQSIPFAQVRQRVHELEMDYIDCHGVPLQLGMLEILSHLQKMQFDMAIATSNRRETAEKYVKTAGLESFFQHIVCCDEVRQGKPHPEIFQKAAQQLNCVPAECLMFEDSENGFKSAHATGGITMFIEDLKAPTAFILDHADFIYPNAQACFADIDQWA